jgi:cytochrome c oxidase subunit 3
MQTVTLDTTIVEKNKSTKKLLLWIAIGSMIMLFAGLTSGYIVRKMEGDWLEFKLPLAFYLSTSIIVLSSITMNMALVNARKNKFAQLNLYLLITLLLGIGFIISQFAGYSSLVKNNVYLVGNPSGSFLYLLSGLHIVHLAGGLIALLVVNIKARMKKYNSEKTLGIELCATYWHFLDVLWIYLFLFLLFIH